MSRLYSPSSAIVRPLLGARVFAPAQKRGARAAAPAHECSELLFGGQAASDTQSVSVSVTWAVYFEGSRVAQVERSMPQRSMPL
jgi:hypothetical protein